MDSIANRNRREAMALLGGAGAAAALSIHEPADAAPGKAAGARPDLATSAGRARAYMMMRGALDDRLVIGCVSGRYYGVVNAVLTPLFGVSAATFSRYRPIGRGGHEAVTAELAYFTDLETGSVIDRFVNPYTKEIVEVPFVRSAPMRIRILPDLSLELDKPVPGLTVDHHVLVPEARGDDLWITEVTRTSATPPGGKPFQYSESTTLHARLSDFDRTGAPRVRCETGFTNVVGWRPWLRMGDRPGQMMAVGAGRYGATLSDLPSAWLDATRRHHPDVLARPESVLEPMWSAL